MLNAIGAAARKASYRLSIATSQEKNDALNLIARELTDPRRMEEILAANSADIAAGREAGLSPSLLDRLLLTPDRIREIADAAAFLTGLADPVGRIDSGWTAAQGIAIEKRRVPLGVIAMIYEARPNVTVDAAALCLKSGNAVILRGGKEAIRSNIALANAMRAALANSALPVDSIQLIEDTSRETSTALMRLNRYVDVLIPRGGAGLIRAVVENATVPVIETGVGNCHIYAEKTADPEMAVRITVNAKCSRPSVCNAAETLLVDREIAPTLLPAIAAGLWEKNVILHGCPETVQILGDRVIPATEEDYRKEYLGYEMAVRVVSGIEEAIDHIRSYSSGHSEAILTQDLAASELFTSSIDSAAVYVNASTRFTDGGQFGFGAEIGISTQKLHARGPLGLPELTSVKYVIRGNGQIR